MKTVFAHEFYEPAIVSDTWATDLSAVEVVAPGVVRLSFTALQRTGMKGEGPVRMIVSRLVLAVPSITAIAATLLDAVEGEPEPEKVPAPPSPPAPAQRPTLHLVTN